jgi:hypothetical protein
MPIMYGLDSYGVSKFSQDGWIPYASVLGAKSICRITVNPNKEEEVYASSFFSGLLNRCRQAHVVIQSN